MQSFDLGTNTLRALNGALHALAPHSNATEWEVLNPRGLHAIAAGLDAEVTVTVRGSTGYYCAGMNKRATVRIAGNAGPGVAENMMSGTVIVEGDASQYAGRPGAAGCWSSEGNAASRCGISMKGIDIVVGGGVGHMSAFMAQKGNLVVLGDAGEALGDSIYEARLFVRGAVKSLGADCVEKEMRAEHLAILAGLLERAGIDADPGRFRRYGSARGSTTSTSTTRGPTDGRDAAHRAAPVGDLRRLHPLRDPAGGGDGDLRHPRWGREAAAAAFRRPAVPRRLDLALSAGGLSRALRHRGDAGHAACGAAAGAAIPITIAGMSFGALSAQAKEALGRGATAAGTSTTTGDGGMTEEERRHSAILVYQYLPSRYGMNPDDLRRADAIEIVVGQGAKPGGGGMLLGQKISDRVAEMRDLPKGIDQRSACRHPDWTGPDDLEIKILELREITDWEKPVYVKIGGARPYYDTALAVKAGRTWWCSTACRAARRRRRRCSSSMSACRRSPASGRRCRRCRSSGCTGRCSWWSRAASATARTWRRRWRSGRMRCRSARRRWWRSATTIRAGRRSIRRSAPRRGL
jgi:methylamine---glutamate N-methyltransferase subunit B